MRWIDEFIEKFSRSDASNEQAYRAVSEEIEKLRADLAAAKDAARVLQRRIETFAQANPDLFKLYFTKKGEEQRRKAEEFRKKALEKSPRFRRRFAEPQQ